MDFLIDDLLLLIFDHFAYSSLVHLKRVNQRFYFLIEKNYQNNKLKLIPNSPYFGHLEIISDYFSFDLSMKIYSSKSPVFDLEKVNQFKRMIRKFDQRLFFNYPEFDNDNYIYLDTGKNQICFVSGKNNFWSDTTFDVSIKIPLKKNQIEILRLLYRLLYLMNLRIEKLSK